MNIPAPYLSISGNSARIISNGAPLLADTSISGAMQFAAASKTELAAQFWDGDKGEWLPMAELKY